MCADRRIVASALLDSNAIFERKHSGDILSGAVNGSFSVISCRTRSVLATIAWHADVLTSLLYVRARAGGRSPCRTGGAAASGL